MRKIDTKSLLPNDEFSHLPTNKLLEILESGLLLERGRALFMLARRSGNDQEISRIVVQEICEPKNRNSKTIGIVSISFLGIAGLLEADTDNTKETVKHLIESWTEAERSDLLVFLQLMYPSDFISSIT
ncbi:hypothetical protein ACX27_17290 [Nostoc piscinale CENA21]|uniref:Uncharacterized protein n=1 Tax=Nostoc piscinale CENA21 TaxID=224013 RepID=A0A0M3V5M8_9NOSO|nr:hypothetical protein [Nostoc piscinale]ALF54193.1 hypothetical protein ACX27_17290 [Nostoc piscinale CENA21]